MQLPIGMLYAASRLRENGISSRIVDLRIQKGEISRQQESFLENSDLVIFGTTDYEDAQCYRSSLRTAERTIESLRTKTSAPVYCVGSHGTVAPEETLQTLKSDGILRGEHEVVIPRFIEKEWNGNNPVDIWPEEQPRQATEEEVRNLKLPEYDRVPVRKYRAPGVRERDGKPEMVNSGLVLAARGCPYACDFCYLLFGSRMRERPTEKVVREMDVLHNQHGVGHVFFLDYTFTLNDDWVLDLCDRLREKELDINWICQTRPDQVRKDLLEKMKNAGCTGVWLGVESPAQTNRASVGKGNFDEDQIHQAIEAVRSSDLVCFLFLLVGFPDETQKSLEHLNRLIEEEEVYYTLSELVPVPGTPLFQEAGFQEAFKEKGWDYTETRDRTKIGLSELDREKLTWFFDFHRNHPKNLSNVFS